MQFVFCLIKLYQSIRRHRVHSSVFCFFFFQAEDGIRDDLVTGVQTCALPICNNRTRDEVIRREFRQYEASWYDGDKIRLSRDRVDRLGFFTEVNVETQEVAGSPHPGDLVISVAEKPTGSLQLGARFSRAGKGSLSFGINPENMVRSV